MNPKINNMLPAYRAAVHPLILVSDSSIKMKEDTLTDMVSSMTENVGLVHQMPCELSRISISFIPFILQIFVTALDFLRH